MSDANVREIVRAAFLDTSDQLRTPITRTLLCGLNDRTPPRVPPAAAAP
jgi:hypothetical protein